MHSHASTFCGTDNRYNSYFRFIAIQVNITKIFAIHRILAVLNVHADCQVVLVYKTETTHFQQDCGNRTIFIVIKIGQ